METVVKIGNVASQLVLSSDSKCENCGYNLKHRDENGLRKWCKRCIDVHYRRESLTPERAERTIVRLVEPLYFDATLDDLDKDVREKLLDLQTGQDVFMFGLVGTGKTYAMAALIKHYVCQGYECKRINFDDFCVKVRSTMSPASKQTEWDMIEPLKQVDKLFIDDLGLRSQQETQFTYQTFYSILNKRQERMLPTFISSNKDITQIGRTFDARIASRLQTAVIIETKGQDRRKQSSANPAPLRRKPKGANSAQSSANPAPSSANPAPLKGANPAPIDNSNREHLDNRRERTPSKAPKNSKKVSGIGKPFTPISEQQSAKRKSTPLRAAKSR